MLTKAACYISGPSSAFICIHTLVEKTDSIWGSVWYAIGVRFFYIWTQPREFL